MNLLALVPMLGAATSVTVMMLFRGIILGRHRRDHDGCHRPRFGGADVLTARQGHSAKGGQAPSVHGLPQAPPLRL